MCQALDWNIAVRERNSGIPCRAESLSSAGKGVPWGESWGKWQLRPVGRVLCHERGIVLLLHKYTDYFPQHELDI